MTFLIKRIARIWPIYAIVAVTAVIFEHNGIGGFSEPSVLMPFLEGLVFIPHNPVASPLYFEMSVDVAWTLCFEFYFYVVFGLAMFLGRYRYWALAAWFAATLIAVPIARGDFTFNVPQPDAIRGFRYANIAICPIVWDFIFGMCAGWLYKSRIIIKRRSIIYMGMTVLIGLMLINWKSLGLINFHGPSGWGAPLALVFCGIVMLSKIGEIRVPACSVWLGGISYSLYLTHVYVFEQVMNNSVILHISSDKIIAYYLVTRIIAAIFIAYLTYRFIEGPSSSFFRKHLMHFFIGNYFEKGSNNRPKEQDPAPAPAGAP